MFNELCDCYCSNGAARSVCGVFIDLAIAWVVQGFPWDLLVKNSNVTKSCHRKHCLVTKDGQLRFCIPSYIPESFHCTWFSHHSLKLPKSSLVSLHTLHPISTATCLHHLISTQLCLKINKMYSISPSHGDPSSPSTLLYLHNFSDATDHSLVLIYLTANIQF